MHQLSNISCVRGCKNLGPSQKEIWVPIRTPIFCCNGVESPLIFYTKKKKKRKTKYKIHVQNTLNVID